VTMTWSSYTNTNTIHNNAAQTCFNFSSFQDGNSCAIY